MTAVSFFRTQVPAADDLVLVKFVRADRSPLCVYLPGDIAGFDKETAKKLVEQGFAELADVGKGPGVPNQDLVRHLPEPHETGDWGAFAAAQRSKG